MSIEMMRYVWKSQKPKHLPRLVLLAMADVANDDGWCWASIHTLHKKTLISERYLRSLVGKLHEDGHIRVYGRFDPETQSQTSNLYFIEHGQLEEPKLPADLKGKIARTMRINKPVKAGKRRAEAESMGVGSAEQGGGEASRTPGVKHASDESSVDSSLTQEHLLDTSDDVPNVIVGGSDKPNISLVPKAKPSAKTGKNAAELEAWRNAVCDALKLPRELAVSVINQYLCLLCHITNCKGEWASMRLTKPIATLDEMAEFGKYVRRRMDERNLPAPRRPKVLNEWGTDFQSKPSARKSWQSQPAVE